jgi:hypothetical protein
MMARPSFDSILFSKTNNVKYIDSTTGFPFHSNLFRQTFDINNADIQHGRNLPQNLHRIKLISDAKLHPTACIVLDVILALESVQCRFGVSQQLELIFNSASNAASIYKKWLISGATFVGGGIEWGCLNETTQQPILIIQRLISFHLKNEQIMIKTLKDTNISPLVCFANITMSLTMEQSNSKTTAASPRKKRATVVVPESKLFFDSWYFTSLEPYGNEIFYPGQTINIRWSYSNIDGTNDLEIVLNRKRFGWNTELSKLSTHINVQQISFTIPASLETSSHDQYYFEFSFRRKRRFYERTSAIFYITIRPSIIPRSPPDVNDVYYPGDFVPIAWDSVNFDAISKVTVRFRRARISIITDAILDTFTVLATANTYNYTISSSLDRDDNDKYYYFEFDCKLNVNYIKLFFYYVYHLDCTSWLSLNCKQSTNTFFVPTRPYVGPTFPAANVWFLPSQLLTLTWTSANFASPNDLLTIKLRRYNYLLPDSDIDTFQCTVSSSGSCTRILPTVSTSLSDYYFEYNWCKHWYSTQCTAKSNRFSISTHNTGSWNYDMNQGQALHLQKLYSTTCSSLCPTQEPKLYYVCRMCAEGRSMAIHLNCTNCWAAYDYSLVQMDLVRKDDSRALDYLSVRVYSSISVNIDLAISANYPYAFNGNLLLPPIPILKTPFTIGNVQFDAGLSFVPSIPWYIEVNTIGNLTGGVDYKLQTNLTLITSGGNTTRHFDQKLVRNNHPIRGDFQANVKIDLAFRPTLQLDVGIFTLEIATEGYVIFENIWRYPPFDALPTSIFDWNQQKTADVHLSIPSNACISSHFIRYHVMFGIRNTQVKFFVTIGNSLINLLTNYTLSYSTPSLLDLGPYELASGCMYVQRQNTDIPKTIYFVFNRKFHPTIDATDEYLSKSVLFDLAYALNVSQTRLYYNSAYGVQQNEMTGVIITLLPSALDYTTDATVLELLEILQVQEMNTTSLLYSGIITNLLNLQQTVIANRLKSSIINYSMSVKLVF